MAVTQEKNLVLGAVRGYRFEQLHPFVASLKKTSFKGDLVLLWNGLDEETLRALRDHGVKLVHFEYRGSGALNSWSRFWPVVRNFVKCPVGDPLRSVVYKKILNLAFVRYLHALDFLKAAQDGYQNVLMTDVRDVFFQDDPFRERLAGDIVAYLESPKMKFGSEPMNDGWIIENYGAESSEFLRGKRISCCGTVTGSAKGMVAYLQAFVREIQGLNSVAHGADTSIHNILVHKILADKIVTVENFHGAVGTINPEAVQENEMAVLGPNGLPVPVLHQYDRLPGLAANLTRALGNSVAVPK